MDKQFVILSLVLYTLATIGCSGGGSKTGEESGNAYFVRVDTMGEVVVYQPAYRHVDLVCGVMPSVEEPDVIFCAEAAFTGKLLDEFEHTNIMGPHVSGGVRYNGYDYN